MRTKVETDDSTLRVDLTWVLGEQEWLPGNVESNERLEGERECEVS